MTLTSLPSLTAVPPSLRLENGQGTLQSGRLDLQRPQAALESAPARELPADAITHGDAVRYTNAQLAMRPVERADAALMSVVDPDAFSRLRDALQQDDDGWRALLGKFSSQIPANPQWLDDAYRLPAARLLDQTRYLMDLSAI